MGDDEENAQEAFPDAHSRQYSSIGNDGRRQEQRGGDRDETFAEGDVFEDRLIGKASELIEQCAADEPGKTTKATRSNSMSAKGPSRSEETKKSGTPSALKLREATLRIPFSNPYVESAHPPHSRWCP